MVEKLTKAQREFLSAHKGGTLDRWSAYGHKRWNFVERVRKLGLIEVVDPENRFPWSWKATAITDTGRAALKGTQP